MVLWYSDPSKLIQCLLFLIGFGSWGSGRRLEGRRVHQAVQSLGSSPVSLLWIRCIPALLSLWPALHDSAVDSDHFCLPSCLQAKGCITGLHTSLSRGIVAKLLLALSATTSLVIARHLPTFEIYSFVNKASMHPKFEHAICLVLGHWLRRTFSLFYTYSFPWIPSSPFVTANTASSLDLSIEFQTSLTAHLLFPLSCLISIINPYIFKIELSSCKLALLTVFPISLSGTPNSSSSS